MYVNADFVAALEGHVPSVGCLKNSLLQWRYMQVLLWRAIIELELVLTNGQQSVH